MILGVFLVACRDFCELRYIASQHWNAFMEPITSGEIDKTQTVKLWRHLEPKLRSSLNQVYVRGPDTCGTQIGLKMELPFFSKFLIIAAYLASYNPARYDRRLFVKAKEGRKNKDKGLKSLKKQKLHNAARLMGPKVFPIDRLMAIFYSIVEERVTPSLNIFVQVCCLPFVIAQVHYRDRDAFLLFNTLDFYIGFSKTSNKYGIGRHVSRSSEISLQCRLRFSQKFSQVNYFMILIKSKS